MVIVADGAAGDFGSDGAVVEAGVGVGFDVVAVAAADVEDLTSR